MWLTGYSTDFPAESAFEWMKFTDKAIWDYIQDKHETQRGCDFRLRFLWRLVILFIISQFNAAFCTAETWYDFISLCSLGDATAGKVEKGMKVKESMGKRNQRCILNY